MTKSDVVGKISKTTGIDRTDVLRTVECFMRVVKDSMASGDNVYLRGFGSFIVKKRAPKKARDIIKKVTVFVDEHYIPAFQPAKTFKQQIKTKFKIK